MEPVLAADLELALQLADLADELTLRSFRSPHDVVLKYDGTPVSTADLDVERAIVERLRDERPGDEVLCEEGGLLGARDGSGRRWVIDPLDHTRHFLRGNPDFATLIGLTVEGVCTVGVTSAPAQERRWHAVLGYGAYTDGKRALRISAWWRGGRDGGE